MRRHTTGVCLSHTRPNCPQLRQVTRIRELERAMLKNYLKSQLWVLLCGGLVGPIYLVVYYKFMSPDDRHYVGWLYWAGWAVTVADVLIALGLANYRAKSSAESAALERD